MKFKLLSVVAMSVLVWLAAATACGNDGAGNLGTPTTVPKESTRSAGGVRGFHRQASLFNGFPAA